MEQSLPDLGSLSEKELRALIEELTAEEREISYKRRLLHGRIDILQAELATREQAAAGAESSDDQHGN
jgi:hypothetical protein